MKKRSAFIILYCILTVFLCGGVKSFAKDSSYAALEKAEDVISGVIGYNLSSSGSKDVREYIDNILPEGIGGSSDWYVLALSQYRSFSFKNYSEALQEYLKNKDLKGATSRLKYALILKATGAPDDYADKCMTDDSVGGQGIMSYVYGLHLYNNGYSGTVGKSFIIGKLKEFRHEDNGWSVTGDYGDVDVTAMVLQSLAPVYADKEDPDHITVADLVEKGIVFLSERQLEDGDFQSFGVRNAESCAQVITALSALGIDADKDERFIKNGNSVFDGLLLYRLSDGSFSHKLNDETNPTATVQGFYSMVAYVRMCDGRGPLFILDEKTEENRTESGQETEIKEEKNTEPEQPAGSDYKSYAMIIIAALAAVALIVLTILKKHFKNHIFVLILAAAGILFVIFTDFSSAKDYYSDTVKKENVSGKVTMSISCSILNGRANAEHIPADGSILETTEFEITEGDTAYDILLDGARKFGISVEHEGSSDMAYISGINYLYEHDFGDLSGWVYKVNGELPSVGCAGYVLKDGDRIEWCYTLDLGNDSFE